MVQRELFVPPITPGTGSSQRLQSANPIRSKPMTGTTLAGSLVKTAATAVAQTAADQAAEYGQRQAEKIKQSIKQKVASAVESRTGSPDISYGKGKRHSSGYSLARTPDARPINLDTGVQPNTYTSDYMQAMENECSPLHMSTVKFQFPTYTESALNSYFKSILAFDLQTKAQSNIGFNLNVSTDFTADRILTAFNALVYALQVYFYYSNILAYYGNPSNKNEGMIYLRTQFTTSIIEKLTLLERRLQDTPCPPNLLEFLRYLMGNFYSGDTSSSPIIRFCPHGFDDTGVLESAITTALTDLDNSNNNTVFTLMRRAVPQWTMGQLFSQEATPYYDPNFKTIFANAPFTYMKSAVSTEMPTVATETTSFKYNTFTENLDGAAFAMTSAYVTASSKRLPGLLVPVVHSWENGSTRTSFYKVGSTTKFYSTRLYPFLSRSRQETYTINDTSADTYNLHLFGADLCQNVTPSAIKETCLNVLDYLMSPNTIRINAKNYLDGQVSNGTRGTSKRRSKKK